MIDRPTSVDAIATGLFAAGTVAVYVLAQATLAALTGSSSVLAAGVASVGLLTAALVAGADELVKREVADRYDLEHDERDGSEVVRL